MTWRGSEIGKLGQAPDQRQSRVGRQMLRAAMHKGDNGTPFAPAITLWAPVAFARNRLHSVIHIKVEIHALFTS